LLASSTTFCFNEISRDVPDSRAGHCSLKKVAEKDAFYKTGVAEQLYLTRLAKRKLVHLDT
jgi:hypothetical protein